MYQVTELETRHLLAEYFLQLDLVDTEMQLFLSCIISKYVSECLTCMSAVSVSHKSHGRLSQHMPPVCLLMLANVVKRATLCVLDLVLSFALRHGANEFTQKSVGFVFLKVRRSNVMDSKDIKYFHSLL